MALQNEPTDKGDTTQERETTPAGQLQAAVETLRSLMDSFEAFLGNSRGEAVPPDCFDFSYMANLSREVLELDVAAHKNKAKGGRKIMPGISRIKLGKLAESFDELSEILGERAPIAARLAENHDSFSAKDIEALRLCNDRLRTSLKGLLKEL